MARRHRSTDDRAEPNLTPILDMVFQLITFFMLVINFKATDFDRSLVLPVIGRGVPIEIELDREYLILNLRANESLQMRGKTVSDIDRALSVEAKLLLDGSRRSNKEERPVAVVIRADRNVPCRFLLRIVETCRRLGLDRFEFMILRTAQEA